MPVAAQVRRMLRHHNEMAHSRDDIPDTPGARVHLPSLIGLDDVDDDWSEGGVHQPNTAHRTTINVITMNVITIARSAVVFSC